LVLEEGRNIGRGTHAELVASSNRYRRLYELDQPHPAAHLST
jgi:ABC-type multidrug transport system fused ATPase/permease subunit